MLVLAPSFDPNPTGLVEVGLTARALGAYLGLAVGDALGATVEFMTPSEIRERHGVHRDILGGGWLRLRKGQVTDDTEMALALGRSILAEGRVEPRAVAEAFSAWMRGKPVDRCIDCELFDKCHKITASVSLLAISDALDLIVQNGLVDGRLKGFAELEEIADAAEGQK